MSGGITQLIAVGQQDVHLTGKPEMSFWHSSYKRYTHFAQGIQRQVIQGQPSAGSISSIRLERKGDLVSYVYLTKFNGEPITMDTAGSEIEYMELYIGGQLIERQYMDYLVKARSLMATTSAKVNPQGLDWSGPDRELTRFFPLRFFFCEQWASALPLVALQYHDVEVRIQWGPQVDTTTQYECWANFVHLDSAERRLLASKEQHMIITQVQRQTPSNGKSVELTFNHPIKYMVTTVSNPNAAVRIQMNGNDLDEMKPVTPHFNFVPEFYHTTHEPRQVFKESLLDDVIVREQGTVNLREAAAFTDSSTLVVVGDQQTSLAAGIEFFVQNGIRTTPKLTVSTVAYDSSTNLTTITVTVPVSNFIYFPQGSELVQAGSYTTDRDSRIDMKQMAKFNFFHPFCLDINRLNPCGAVNFSRIDSTRLVSDEPIWTEPIYAQNYNVLKISNGMAGLLYAN